MPLADRLPLPRRPRLAVPRLSLPLDFWRSDWRVSDSVMSTPLRYFFKWDLT